MKKILIIRHAKSDWGQLPQSDFERNLNERGIANAKLMGERLKKRSLLPDFFMSSSATRAKETALSIAKEIGFDESKIDFSNTLYHANEEMLIEHVLTLDDKHSHAIIVAHNPGITYFINHFSGDITMNVPTCGMAQFIIHTERWSDFLASKVELDFYDFPKNLG